MPPTKKTTTKKKTTKKKTSATKGLTDAEAKALVKKLSPQVKARLKVYW